MILGNVSDTGDAMGASWTIGLELQASLSGRYTGKDDVQP